MKSSSFSALAPRVPRWKSEMKMVRYLRSAKSSWSVTGVAEAGAGSLIIVTIASRGQLDLDGAGFASHVHLLVVGQGVRTCCHRRKENATSSLIVTELEQTTARECAVHMEP